MLYCPTNVDVLTSKGQLQSSCLAKPFETLQGDVFAEKQVVHMYYLRK